MLDRILLDIQQQLLVVDFILIGDHLVEQLLDLVTVFANIVTILSIAKELLSSCSLETTVEVAIDFIVALVGLAQLVYLFECFGLLVLLGVQRIVHIEV